MLIALHRGEGFIARAIRWQTRSVYSHASVLLEDSQMVIEAREFQGVRVVMWKDVVASGEVVDLFRVKDISAEQEKIVLEFLWEQMGKGYDYTMVARFISRRQEERASSGKWFCSELVFAALAQAGVRLLERIEAWEVSPGVLRLSTRLEEVQGSKFEVQSWGKRDVEASSRLGGTPTSGTGQEAEASLRTPRRGAGGDACGTAREPRPKRRGITRALRGGDWTGGGACPTTDGVAGEGACPTMADGGVCPTTGLGQARGNSRSTIADSQGGICVR